MDFGDISNPADPGDFKRHIRNLALLVIHLQKPAHEGGDHAPRAILNAQNLAKVDIMRALESLQQYGDLVQKQ